MKVNAIIERAKAILMQPRDVWESIKEDIESVADIYKNYLVYLAIIPAVCKFIGFSIIGYSIPFSNSIVRMPFGEGLKELVLSYIFSLLGIYLVAVIVAQIAPRLEATKSTEKAFKLIAYSVTPAWLAGLLYIIPSLGQLAILGVFYGIYVLYQGLPTMLESPRENNVALTLVVVAAAVVVWIVIKIIETQVFSLGALSSV